MVKKNNFLKLLNDKKGFLLQVYLVLIFQLVLTYGVVYYFRNHPTLSKITNQSFWIYLILSIILILLLINRDIPTYIRFVIFIAYSLVSGALLYNLSKFATKEFINQILLSIIGLFIGLVIIGFILTSLGFNLEWMGILILVGLIALLIGMIVLVFTEESKEKKDMYRILLIFGLVLFSLDLVYSTNMMLQVNYDNDVIRASIDLYINFINMFSYLFKLESLE